MPDNSLDRQAKAALLQVQRVALPGCSVTKTTYFSRLSPCVVTAILSHCGHRSTVLRLETEMDNFTAVGIAEGFIDADSEEQVLEAWQHLIDTKLAWSLQGWFGRTAQALIDAGHCRA